MGFRLRSVGAVGVHDHHAGTDVVALLEDDRLGARAVRLGRPVRVPGGRPSGRSGRGSSVHLLLVTDAAVPTSRVAASAARNGGTARPPQSHDDPRFVLLSRAIRAKNEASATDGDGARLDTTADGGIRPPEAHAYDRSRGWRPSCIHGTRRQSKSCVSTRAWMASRGAAEPEGKTPPCDTWAASRALSTYCSRSLRALGALPWEVEFSENPPQGPLEGRGATAGLRAGEGTDASRCCSSRRGSQRTLRIIDTICWAQTDRQRQLQFCVGPSPAGARQRRRIVQAGNRIRTRRRGAGPFDRFEQLVREAATAEPKQASRTFLAERGRGSCAARRPGARTVGRAAGCQCSRSACSEPETEARSTPTSALGRHPAARAAELELHHGSSAKDS